MSSDTENSEECPFHLARPHLNLSDESARRQRSRNLTRLRSIAPSRSTPPITAPFRKLTPSKRPCVTTQQTSRAVVEARNDALRKAARARHMEATKDLRKRRMGRWTGTGREVKDRNEGRVEEKSQEEWRREEEGGETVTRKGRRGRFHSLPGENATAKALGKNAGVGYFCTDGNQSEPGVQVLVGSELWGRTGTGAILEQVRSAYGDRVNPIDDFVVSNGIRWRREAREGAADFEWGMVVFAGDAFVEYLERSLMREYVTWVIQEMELLGKRLIIVGVGVEEAVKKRRKGMGSVEIDAVTDICTMLMMDFGVRVALFEREEEVAGYILQVTDGIDKQRFYKEKGFLETTRDDREERAFRATEEEDEGKGVRVDSDGELGRMYTKMLTGMGGISAREAAPYGKGFQH